MKKKPSEYAVLTFLATGMGYGLYTEVIDLAGLGRLRIERATQIEFDNGRQAWVVRDRAGKELYAAACRQECLDWERRTMAGV